LTGAVPEPDLSDEERRQVAEGMDQFNRGLFFECHDTLEDVWTGIRGPSRDFFQGLIQVAVGFYHLGNDNRGGAATLLRRGLSRLAKYPDTYGGIDLVRLRREVQEWLGRVEAGDASFPQGLEALPKLVDPAGTPT
jgi:predicted metal-dependent hydrolase